MPKVLKTSIIFALIQCWSILQRKKIFQISFLKARMTLVYPQHCFMVCIAPIAMGRKEKIENSREALSGSENFWLAFYTQNRKSKPRSSNTGNEN